MADDVVLVGISFDNELAVLWHHDVILGRLIPCKNTAMQIVPWFYRADSGEALKATGDSIDSAIACVLGKLKKQGVIEDTSHYITMCER